MDMSQLRPRTGLIVALAAFAVYLALPTREFYWDGVGFALAIESRSGSPESLLFPNHLLYNLAGYVAWRGISALGVEIRALFVLQALNSLFAAASVYLLWDITASITRSSAISTWCALLFCFSSQWWRFSTDADAYIPSIFFLLLSFRFLLRGPRPRPFAVGLAHGAAMLFHQLGLFFFPVAAAGMFRTFRKSGPAGARQGLIAVAKYTVTASAVTGALYLLAFRLVRPYIGSLGFGDWITMRAADAAFWTNPVHSLRYSLRGTMRLFFGGRVNRLASDWVTVAGALAFVAILAMAVIFFFRYRRDSAGQTVGNPRTGIKEWCAANHLTLVWILTYYAFLFFWQPQNTFYRLFYLPPLILALAALPVWRARRTQLLAFLAGIVCAWNFTVAIYPNARASANEVLTFALDRRNGWQEGSQVLYANSHADLWLIRYFNPQVAWIEFPAPTPESLETRRTEAVRGGTPLWLEGTAFDSVAAESWGKAWIEKHVDAAGSFIFTTPPHRIRYYRVR